MRNVLVCGGRDYKNADKVKAVLDALHKQEPIYVIEGGARGADNLAWLWATTTEGAGCVTVAAKWKEYGRTAGAIRNQQMLEWNPKLVVAFPGGKGTADMISRTRKAGIEVMIIEE